MQPTSSGYLITPQQTRSVALQSGCDEEAFKLGGIAIITFSKGVLDRLEELCTLKDETWISKLHHPYSAAEVFKRGAYQGINFTVLVPPMGASPLACIIEDLVACGVGVIFLACAAWSLGPPVAFGELVVPEFSIGLDGTSIHYGNTTGHITANPKVVEALVTACREREVRFHRGGNATCEAMYRISPEMVADFRQRGCLCMENGEASTLFAVTNTLGVLGGVLFQPYIDLQQGWNPDRLDERYRITCFAQAEIVLDAAIRLEAQGRLRES